MGDDDKNNIQATADDDEQPCRWWTDEVAALHQTCVDNRRKYTKLERKQYFSTNPETQEALRAQVAEAYASYKKSARAFNIAISKAKALAKQHVTEGAALTET